MNTSAYDAAQSIVSDILPLTRQLVSKKLYCNYGDINDIVDQGKIARAVQFDIDEVYGSYLNFLRANCLEIERIVNDSLPKHWYVSMHIAGSELALSLGWR